MKIKIIVASWLISLMLLATDNMIQVLIALCVFSISSYLIEKCKVEVIQKVEHFEQMIDKLIN